MTPSEAAQLLTMMSAVDGREVTEPAARAWAAILHDVDLASASEYLIEHFREVHALGYQRIMPADVRTGVVAMHTRKVRRAVVDAYRQVLDGTPMHEATPAHRARALQAAHDAEAGAKVAAPLGTGMLEIEAPKRPTW